MTAWRDLLDAAGFTIADIKEGLPVEWVASVKLNIGLERVPDGRLIGLCPLHPDVNPSFAIYGDALDRWGCWSCSRGGDVIDLVQEVENLEFKAALASCVEWLKEFQGVGEAWTGSPPPEEAEVDLEELAQVPRAALATAQSDLTDLAGLILRKNLPLSPTWLRDTFYVGSTGFGSVVIPHLIRLSDGRLQITGYKTRHESGHPYAASGSHLSEMYGAWRVQGHETLIVCEGESDTWRVAWEYREEPVDVVGLPSGAKPPRTAWLDLCRDRNVVVLMDGDLAGRRAAKAWHDRLRDVARSVKVAALDEGEDACTTLDLRGAIADAAQLGQWTGQVDWNVNRETFVRSASGVPVCNWALEPRRLVTVVEGGVAIEGTLPDGRVAVLSSEDLTGETSARAWSNARGLVWLGTSKDAQGVLELLLREAPFLSRGKGTRVTGWHEGNFVLPTGESIGPQPWSYVPPPAVTLEPWQVNGHGDPLVAVQGFIGAHVDRAVTTPILAWFAAAPLRGLLKEFPPLAVVGGSGSGKTTLVEQAMRLFGWNPQERNLSSTTPYGVAMTVGLTNAVPTWFDEFRLGARSDTLQAMTQALRDAWTGSRGVRGGVNRANASQLHEFPVTAPIVISGEDTLSETSLVERVVIVEVPRAGRLPDGLRILRACEPFGVRYLLWLVSRHWSGALDLPRRDVLERQDVGHRVLEWGWELLEEFTATDLGKLERRAAPDVLDPVIEALLWSLDERDRGGKPITWFEDGDVLLFRPRALVQTVRDRGGSLVLPGGERATKHWLDEWFTEEGRPLRSRYGQAVSWRTARARLREEGLLGPEPSL